MSEELRILIVDDDSRMVKTLVDILTVKGYQAEAAHSGPEALKKVKDDQFDCVLTDIKMPEANGVELLRSVKTKRPDLPVLFMSAYATGDLVEEGLREGALGSLTKPLDMNLLLDFFSNLPRERSIVVIDRDRQASQTLGDMLGKRGFAVIEVRNRRCLCDNLRSEGQVVLLDARGLGGLTGPEVLREIREKYDQLPVVLLVGCREELRSLVEAAVRLDVRACLQKPFELEELLQVLADIRREELCRLLPRTSSTLLGQPA